MPGIQPPPPPVRQESLPQVFSPRRCRRRSGTPTSSCRSRRRRRRSGRGPATRRPARRSPPCPWRRCGAPVKPTVSFWESTQLGVPHDLAGLHVERDQPAVHGADIDLAFADARRRGCRASASVVRPARRRVPGSRTRSPRRWRRSAQRRGCRSRCSRARRRPRAASTAGRASTGREYGSRQRRDSATLLALI